MSREDAPIYVKAIFQMPKTCYECPMIGYNMMCRLSLVPTPSTRNIDTPIWCELRLDKETTDYVIKQMEKDNEPR